MIEFDGRLTRKVTYYQIKDRNSSQNLVYEDSKRYILNHLEESIKKMLIADVEVGCFLSGGVDSSLVALLMQRNLRRKIKTFSVGFFEKEYDESSYAKSVSQKIGS